MVGVVPSYTVEHTAACAVQCGMQNQNIKKHAFMRSEGQPEHTSDFDGGVKGANSLLLGWRNTDSHRERPPLGSTSQHARQGCGASEVTHRPSDSDK